MVLYSFGTSDICDLMQPMPCDFELSHTRQPRSQERLLVCGQQHLHVPAWPAAAAACCSALHTAVVPIMTGNSLISQSGISQASASMFKTGSNPVTAVAALAAATDADSSGDDTDLEYWDYHRLSRQVCAPFRQRAVVPSAVCKAGAGSCSL